MSGVYSITYSLTESRIWSRMETFMIGLKFEWAREGSELID